MEERRGSRASSWWTPGCEPGAPCAPAIWELQREKERAKPHGRRIEIEAPRRARLFTFMSTFLTQLINPCTWVDQSIYRFLSPLSSPPSFSPRLSKLIAMTTGRHKRFYIRLTVATYGEVVGVKEGK